MPTGSARTPARWNDRNCCFQATPCRDDFANEVQRGRRDGRPVWTVLDGVVVPRLDLRAGLPGPSQHTRRDELIRLTDTALHDLYGHSIGEICRRREAAFASEGTDDHQRFSSIRVVEDDLAIGRQLWTGLGAWPWRAIDPRQGQFPDEWWTLLRVTETFAAWRAPERYFAGRRQEYRQSLRAA